MAEYEQEGKEISEIRRDILMMNIDYGFLCQED